MCYPRFEALRMLRRQADAGHHDAAQHHRHGRLAAGHVAELGGVVGELVHR